MSNGNFAVKNINWVIPPLLLGTAFVAVNNRFKLVELADRWTVCAGAVSGVALNLIFSRPKSPDKAAEGSFQYRSLVFPIAFYGLQAYLIRNELSEFRPYEWATPFTAGVAGILFNGLVGVNAVSTVAQKRAAEHASDLGSAFTETLPLYSIEAAKALGVALRKGKDCLAARLMAAFPNINYLDPEGLSEEQVEFVKKRNSDLYVAKGEAVGGDPTKRVDNLFTSPNPVKVKGPWSDLYGPKQEGKLFDYQLGVLNHWRISKNEIDQFNFVAAEPLLGKMVGVLMDGMTNLQVAEIRELQIGALLDQNEVLDSVTIHLEEGSDGGFLPVESLVKLGELIIVSKKKITDNLIKSMGEKSRHCEESQREDGWHVYTFLDEEKLPAHRASMSNLSFSSFEDEEITINEKE